MEGKVNNKFSNLPTGWEVKKLKDVAINGGDYGANAPALPYKIGDVRYIRITDIDDYGHLISEDKASLDETIAQNYLLKDNDILFARTGDTVGKSLLYKSSMGRAAYAGYLIRFTLDEKLILPEYFDAIAKSDIFEAFKISMRRIGAKPNINSREYGIFRFPMPLNLDEQKEIAKLFTKVDEAIASVQNRIAAAERLKKSLMQNLLTGKMKPDGTFRTPDEFYIDEKFGKVPIGWEVKSIDEISDFVQYGLNISSSDNGQIPMLRMNNIVNGEMSDSPLVYVNLKDQLLQQYELEAGDILFNRTNSMDLVGKVGVFRLMEKYVFASYLIRVRVSKENNPYYINLALNSYPIQCSLRSKATPAVSQANINSKSLRHTQIFKHKKKDEQDLVMSKIEEVEHVILQKNDKVKKLEQLKKSLMQNLLTGKIKIDKDI